MHQKFAIIGFVIAMYMIFYLGISEWVSIITGGIVFGMSLKKRDEKA